MATAGVSTGNYDDEFIPIISVDNDQNGYADFQVVNLDCLPATVLSGHIDSNKRSQPLYGVIFDSDAEIIVRFVVSKGNKDADDKDGKITVKGNGVTITGKTEIEQVKYGWKILVKLSPKNIQPNAYLDFYASDEGEGWFDSLGIHNNIFCGRVKIMTKSSDKDVFTKEDVDRLISEINYIKPFADASFAPEYDENYCMQAAERGLSELLNDTTNFYSVERETHKHNNKIGFSGKTAIDRGNKFNSLGFVKSNYTFDGYEIDHTKRKSIIDINTYNIVKYDIISFKSGKDKELFEYFNDGIKNKIGFHVYYLTITNGFHTLILIIDNLNPCETKYEIYDQHGLTSSLGKLTELAEGIRRQTSWTFANSCLNRYSQDKSSAWDSTKTFLWKIQKK